MNKALKSFTVIIALMVISCSDGPPPPPPPTDAPDSPEATEAPKLSMDFPEGVMQHAVHADEIEWKPTPPSLPPGCEMAVLEGNPRANEIFTVRFRANKDFLMPAHTHPKDERVTILEGKAYVAFGENAKKEDAKEFGPIGLSLDLISMENTKVMTIAVSPSVWIQPE